MLGSVRWPCLVLLVVVLVLPGDVLSAVLVAGLVIVAGVFVVQVAVPVRRHLYQPSAGRTTGGRPSSPPRPGLPVLVVWEREGDLAYVIEQLIELPQRSPRAPFCYPEPVTPHLAARNVSRVPDAG